MGRHDALDGERVRQGEEALQGLLEEQRLVPTERDPRAHQVVRAQQRARGGDPHHARAVRVSGQEPELERRPVPEGHARRPVELLVHRGPGEGGRGSRQALAQAVARREDPCARRIGLPRGDRGHPDPRAGERMGASHVVVVGVGEDEVGDASRRVHPAGPHGTGRRHRELGGRQARVDQHDLVPAPQADGVVVPRAGAHDHERVLGAARVEQARPAGAPPPRRRTSPRHRPRGRPRSSRRCARPRSPGA